MSTSPEGQPAPPASIELMSALRRGDRDAARALATSSAPPALVESAHAAMRLRRWDDAAWLFEQLPGRDASVDMKRSLARNLAALQRHRESVYETILSLPTDDGYGIAPAPTGRPTVIVRRSDGSRLSLSAGPDPVAASLGAFNQLKSAAEQGQALGMCGIGDGYLLQFLAANPPKLFMDMQQPVFLIESDAQVVLHCLMIHDYTGPGGPIEQPRFHWFVGAECVSALTHALSADLCLPSPAVVVSQRIAAAPLAAGIRSATRELQQQDNRTRNRVEAYYAQPGRPSIATLLGTDSPRRPRVMLITTRFSSVLQYSTRDTAEAFGRLGWDALVLIEPSPAHRLFQAAMRQALADFQPDLVFQLDHLRYEHEDLFPAELPFVCWIQDHLPNLRIARAGQSISDRDFVLTDAPSTYSGTFGYPERQCIPLPKLTREAQEMPLSEHDKNNEIVFVSNASHVPERILRERLDTYDGTPAGRKLLDAAAQRLVETYSKGGVVGTYHEVIRLIRGTQRDLSSMVGTTEFDSIAAWVTHPLNDALYRQQALRWAASAATDIGLTLSLYGAGWNHHPEFAAHARGPVSYGAELHELTRRSRINLQIVPYLCLHQRLLDGLMAGGFFLIRSHTADVAAPALLNYLHANAPAARTSAAARSAVRDEQLPMLNELIEGCRPAIATSDLDDPVTAVWDFADMRLLMPREQVLPRFDLTRFIDAFSLRGAVTRFLADPKLAALVQQAQRASVVERFTYDAGVRRVVADMADRLCSGATRGGGVGGRTTVTDAARRAV